MDEVLRYFTQVPQNKNTLSQIKVMHSKSYSSKKKSISIKMHLKHKFNKNKSTPMQNAQNVIYRMFTGLLLIH